MSAVMTDNAYYFASRFRELFDARTDWLFVCDSEQGDRTMRGLFRGNGLKIPEPLLLLHPITGKAVLGIYTLPIERQDMQQLNRLLRTFPVDENGTVAQHLARVRWGGDPVVLVEPQPKTMGLYLHVALDLFCKPVPVPPVYGT